ncbi:hypothetical protein CAPTEDRAFT_120701 [Capitella teleta]|uniref:MORN repeat-containing protein 4 n=1 Tax=Capitella teleta TaxID=283909 RepID=R7UDE0_CAPTE|nr:hypothetical protein CAPTEDRAFT_120701 [Capitella teleta]|eukprot:ELU01813.1 hypothetical protein CAPTEDRAFT_120701 [Capitella teleta]
MRSYYKYPDGAEYDGEWNSDGQRHGSGQMTFPDKSRYIGLFNGGLCDGYGSMRFPDGSSYEGEFAEGKFNGAGVFTRGDGMRFEGQFKDGRINGYGLITFADGTHGLPRNEGFFENTRIVRREKCPSAVDHAIQAAEKARMMKI